ncbi:unnamed protein product [Trichogramma brassicae]|uniref:K Homology domain-containing protein n=2 Tax=Apocrita TaxID=7400 RepID=A0A6H5I874_9HYME|nr:unnamed protein product [Trichogramma brassicae]
MKPSESRHNCVPVDSYTTWSGSTPTRYREASILKIYIRARAATIKTCIRASTTAYTRQRRDREKKSCVTHTRRHINKIIRKASFNAFVVDQGTHMYMKMSDQMNNSTTQSIADYLSQLLKDRKQLVAFPSVFIHVERLLDEVTLCRAAAHAIRRRSERAPETEPILKWTFDLETAAIRPIQQLLPVCTANSSRESYTDAIIFSLPAQCADETKKKKKDSARNFINKHLAAGVHACISTYNADKYRVQVLPRAPARLEYVSSLAVHASVNWHRRATLLLHEQHTMIRHTCARAFKFYYCMYNDRSGIYRIAAVAAAAPYNARNSAFRFSCAPLEARAIVSCRSRVQAALHVQSDDDDDPPTRAKFGAQEGVGRSPLVARAAVPIRNDDRDCTIIVDTLAVEYIYNEHITTRSLKTLYKVYCKHARLCIMLLVIFLGRLHRVGAPRNESRAKRFWPRNSITHPLCIGISMRRYLNMSVAAAATATNRQFHLGALHLTARTYLFIHNTRSSISSSHVNSYLQIAKVRASLFQISGVKKEPLALPEAEGEVTTLTEKVYVPVKEHPDRERARETLLCKHRCITNRARAAPRPAAAAAAAFNFVGRILGPRGMTAKQLEQETGCKIMVRGKGSMRDKKKKKRHEYREDNQASVLTHIPSCTRYNRRVYARVQQKCSMYTQRELRCIIIGGTKQRQAKLGASDGRAPRAAHGRGHGESRHPQTGPRRRGSQEASDTRSSRWRGRAQEATAHGARHHQRHLQRLEYQSRDCIGLRHRSLRRGVEARRRRRRGDAAPSARSGQPDEAAQRAARRPAHPVAEDIRAHDRRLAAQRLGPGPGVDPLRRRSARHPVRALRRLRQLRGADQHAHPAHGVRHGRSLWWVVRSLTLSSK